MIKKKIIFGCESRGEAQSPYLTRWQLVNSKWLGVYVHRFHRSDSEDHHDHPWAFVSLILWRGYIEETTYWNGWETRSGTVKEMDALLDLDSSWTWGGYGAGDSATLIRERIEKRRRRFWPGMLLFRRATHRHRVILVDDKECWSLIVRGPYVREWGFFVKGGWQRWKEYFKERGC